MLRALSIIMLLGLMACESNTQDNTTQREGQNAPIAVIENPPVVEEASMKVDSVISVVRWMHNAPDDTFILRSTYAGILDGAIEVVFEAGGNRYMLYTTCDGSRWECNNRDRLSVWVHPVGTTDRDLIETFTDHGLDGNVNWAIYRPDFREATYDELPRYQEMMDQLYVHINRVRR